jgi:hypothetical protein
MLGDAKVRSGYSRIDAAKRGQLLLLLFCKEGLLSAVAAIAGVRTAEQELPLCTTPSLINITACAGPLQSTALP